MEGNKYSQPQAKEGLPQKDNAEHERYVGAYDSTRITENNITGAKERTECLLEETLSKDNMNRAYKKVNSNKGSHGVDKVKVEGLLEYLKENWEEIRESILKGKYKPNPVRRVEIPGEDGKKRPLGISIPNKLEKRSTGTL